MRTQKLFLSLSLPELALVGVTMIWGGSYAAMHWALEYCGPLFFVGGRFLLAGVLTALLFARQLRHLTLYEVVAGLTIGVAVCLGQVLQTLGLMTVTISQSAFLTALYVPTVPLLQWIIMRKPPRLMAWFGLGLAFGGLLLLTEQGLNGLASIGDFTPGDTLTLLSALAIAFEIVLISWFAQEGTGKHKGRRLNIANVTAVQLIATGIYAFAAMPFMHESLPAFSWGWMVPTVAMGVASVAIQLSMNWAQRDISPTRATVIYASEPVWGGLFGWALGERLPGHAFLGAALIVAGVIVSELKLKKPQPEKS